MNGAEGETAGVDGVACYNPISDIPGETKKSEGDEESGYLFEVKFGGGFGY